MNEVDKFLKKSGNKILGIVVAFIFTWILGKLLDWATEKYSTSILDFLKSKIELPIFALVLSILIVWIAAHFYKLWVVSKRKLKIIKATYGANETRVNITSELNKAVLDNKLKVVISNALAGDPIPGVVKVASVHYEYAGERQNININEGGVLELP